jgi:hypothetical protein
MPLLALGGNLKVDRRIVRGWTDGRTDSPRMDGWKDGLIVRGWTDGQTDSPRMDGRTSTYCCIMEQQEACFRVFHLCINARGSHWRCNKSVANHSGCVLPTQHMISTNVYKRLKLLSCKSSRFCKWMTSQHLDLNLLQGIHIYFSLANNIIKYSFYYIVCTKSGTN